MAYVRSGMAPDLIAVLRRNLAAALRRGDVREAEELLRRLEHHDPLSATTRGLGLQVLLAADQLDEARRLAVQLVEQHPDSAGILFWSARAAYRQRNYREAARLLAESRRVADRWPTRRWLGKALTQSGELDEAERLLVPLAEAGHEVCNLDLVWLYERRGEIPRARQILQEHLRAHPDDRFALAQRTRLLAREAEPEELLAEVEDLQALGETVPAEMLPRYVEALLSTGRGDQAREAITGLRGSLDARQSTQVGWVAYRLQAYDLACDLFVDALPYNLRDPKFLNSLGKAARVCQRQRQVIEALERHTDQEPKLYGRIRRLQAQLPREDDGEEAE